MSHQLFTDHPAFVSAWHQTLSRLDETDKDLITSLIFDREARSQVARRYGVTSERIRQLAVSAIARFLQSVHENPGSPIALALQNANRVVNAAGIELAYAPKGITAKRSREIQSQLLNIGSIAPDQGQWAIAAVSLIDPPDHPKPSLSGMAKEARMIAAQHHQGISPRHLRQHLDAWEHATKQWPGFDLVLHIQAMTANSPDPESGNFHPVTGWNIRVPTDPIFTSHYTTLAIFEADQPLTIPEIAQAANRLALRDGTSFTYSEQQIRSVIHVHKKFKWVGSGTWGLASWDVGHSEGAINTTNRVKIADEILHVLESATEPVTFEQIKDHILSRFQVTEHAVHAAFERRHGRQRFIINPDRTVSLNPQEVAPTR